MHIPGTIIRNKKDAIDTALILKTHYDTNTYTVCNYPFRGWLSFEFRQSISSEVVENQYEKVAFNQEYPNVARFLNYPTEFILITGSVPWTIADWKPGFILRKYKDSEKSLHPLKYDRFMSPDVVFYNARMRKMEKTGRDYVGVVNNTGNAERSEAALRYGEKVHTEMEMRVKDYYSETQRRIDPFNYKLHESIFSSIQLTGLNDITLGTNNKTSNPNNMRYLSTELGYDIHWDGSRDSLVIIDTESKETFHRREDSASPVNGIIFHYNPMKKVLRIYEQTFIVDCMEVEEIVQSPKARTISEYE